MRRRPRARSRRPWVEPRRAIASRQWGERIEARPGGDGGRYADVNSGRRSPRRAGYAVEDEAFRVRRLVVDDETRRPPSPPAVCRTATSAHAGGICRVQCRPRPRNPRSPVWHDRRRSPCRHRARCRRERDDAVVAAVAVHRTPSATLRSTGFGFTVAEHRQARPAAHSPPPPRPPWEASPAPSRDEEGA